MADNEPDAPPISHKWQPIQNLPDNWADLCRPDLHAVHRQWIADRKLIKDEAKLNKFQEELELLWAIETGVIERLYTVDRGATLQILEAGMEALGQFHEDSPISTDAESLIRDQRAALDMVMDLVGQQREMTPFYVKDLHQRLTVSQATRDVLDQNGTVKEIEWRPSEKGVWKKWPNNPLQPDGSIHEYCPPEQVDSEIDQLLSWSKQHEVLDVCAEVEAAWLHHRFAQIHPFIDGNGRVARALTGAVFLKADYLVLVVRDEEHRAPYLDALRAADRGDLKPLVDLFADIQRADLQDALKIIRALRGEETVQSIEAAAEAARHTQDATIERVAGILDELMRVAVVRFEEIAVETQHAFESQGVVVSTLVSDDDANDLLWTRHILAAVSDQGYRMDVERPWRCGSLRLGLPARPEADVRLGVVLYATGNQPRGYAASAFLMRPYDGDWQLRRHLGNPFFFDLQPATEALEDNIAQFRVWLEDQITASLREWTYDL